MKKKKWLRPKLIVLVKGTPEERLLIACKGMGWGSDNIVSGCGDTRDCFGLCASWVDS